MKTSKTILLFATSILITSTISAGLAGGLYGFFNIAFWNSFWFFFCLQVLGSFLWDRYAETNQIVAAVKEYNNKPYRKYLIPLNCGHCGYKNEIEIDLTDNEFQCSNCLKNNGIHVNFMAAAITEPISSIVQ